ncbi:MULTISPECIES: oligoribonuclease [Gammaproteobacteria]|uniref:oligoribonuclease n=1 Tax=Gammaproteobacteria TaxID=1236 RepID=UPI000DCFD974|nr:MULTISPECIES: oligoribonuclease [Gammaproteobacteria]RTE85701.1 oligoribonuclease [Aliidiomarina sp. B3213]TCZ90298.1 oligoribonuclease [Lysobacter sp. N42]
MAENSGRLIWIDLEMTGLSPENDVIIEVATIVTDDQLNEIAVGPVIAVHQPNEVLDAMDDWNTRTHTASGLVKRIQESNIDTAAAEQQTIAFLKEHLAANTSPMCGNSICQDRRFLARYMPELESYFHYRNLDVSTVKELAKRWKPGIISGFKKSNAHEALADIRESIEELKYYREHFFNEQ